MSGARQEWSYARPRAGPLSPEPAKPGPGQLPRCGGAGTQAGAGWHRRVQAGTVRGWSCAAAAREGMGCFGVRGHQGKWAELLCAGNKGPGGELQDGKL